MKLTEIILSGALGLAASSCGPDYAQPPTPIEKAEASQNPIITIPDAIAARKSFEEDVAAATYAIGKQIWYEHPRNSLVIDDVIHTSKRIATIGTGTVIGTEIVNGRTEYNLLTNNHVVASPENSNGNKRVKTKWSIVENIDDTYEEDDIELEVVAEYPDKDLAIVRTVNAPELNVAKLHIGTPVPLTGAHTLTTVGIPLGKEKITAQGKITNFKYYEAGALPVPQYVYSATIPIDPGQSGSVVTATFEVDGEIQHFLIGLIYASMNSSDTVRLITPIEGAEEFLEKKETIPSKRPSFSAPISEAVIDNIAEQEDRNYHLRDVGIRVTDGEHKAIHYFVRRNNTPITNKYLSTHFSLKDGKADVSRITFTDGDETKELCEGTDYYDALTTAVLNQVALQEKMATLNDSFEHNREQKQQLKYLEDVTIDMSQALKYDFNAFFTTMNLEYDVPKEYVDLITLD